MKLLILLIMAISFTSCTPEQAATEYSLTAKPMVGPNDVISTLEDTPIEFVYSIAQTLENENKHTIDLNLVMSVGPKHGDLTSCEQQDSLTFKCLYTPHANYSGEDVIEFKSKDGDFLSQESSKLLIQITEVADRPMNLKDVQVSVLQGGTVEFQVPIAEDPDTAAGQLQYQIIENVNQGTLECFHNSDGPQLGNRTCIYTAGTSFYGDTIAKYNVKDETNLSAETHGKMTISVGRVSYSAEENFTQGAQGNVSSVDLTWVVDNSGSMSDEQAALESNFNSFINNFLVDTNNDGVGDKARFPFKMIVTSTEAYISGKPKFRSPDATTPYDLTSSLAETNFNQFKQNFTDAVLMGTGGSGTEKSMLSADFLYQAKGADWYGGNDTLNVYIILSDELEQSTTKTAAEWVTHFQALKDDNSKTKIYPIIRLQNDSGDRYKNIALGTAGQLYDITQPFDQILNDISMTVSNLLDSFALNPNRVIIADSIKVYINNYETTSGWTFQNQSIKFDTDPPANATVKVTYNYYNVYNP